MRFFQLSCAWLALMIYVYDSRLVNICGFIADFDGRRNLFGFMNIFTLYIININKFFLSLVLACHVSAY